MAHTVISNQKIHIQCPTKIQFLVPVLQKIFVNVSHIKCTVSVSRIKQACTVSVSHTECIFSAYYTMHIVSTKQMYSTNANCTKYICKRPRKKS